MSELPSSSFAKPHQKNPENFPAARPPGGGGGADNPLFSLRDLSKEPKQPGTLERAARVLTGVVGMDQLTYVQASVAAKMAQGILMSVDAHEMTAMDPELRRQFFESYDVLGKMGKVHGVVKELKDRARPNPDRFFDSGSSTVYVKRELNGRIVNWPEGRYDPLKRVCYNYLTGIFPAKYLPDTAETERALADYRNPRKQQVLEENLDALPNVETKGILDGFFYATNKGNKMSDKNDSDGRIYINSLPNHTPRAFLELAKKLNDYPEMVFKLKMLGPSEGTKALDLNRADKMVLYFKAGDEAKILEIMRQFYEVVKPSTFEDRTPKLVAQLKGKDGKLMRGIAFGQEPDPDLYGKNNSFNNIREGCFQAVHQNGVSVDSPDFERAVMEQFKRFNIDPRNPAFNYPPEKGQSLFPVIASNSY